MSRKSSKNSLARDSAAGDPLNQTIDESEKRKSVLNKSKMTIQITDVKG